MRGHGVGFVVGGVSGFAGARVLRRGAGERGCGIGGGERDVAGFRRELGGGGVNGEHSLSICRGNPGS